jgi:HNH endonuclease/AP2 domain
MATSDVISAEELREVLHYDPSTGVFSWKTCGRKSWVGKTVGSWDLYGYKTVRLAGRSYKLHRLAWLYVTGEWPDGDIDHINGVRHDNRMSNLRAVCRQTNLQNMREPKNNRSTGVLGVYPQKKKFCAKISIDNKSVHLGTFDTVAAAHEAYINAKRKMHDGCAI